MLNKKLLSEQEAREWFIDNYADNSNRILQVRKVVYWFSLKDCEKWLIAKLVDYSRPNFVISDCGIKVFLTERQAKSYAEV